MENDYYLKYKSKYLELKKQLGGYKCENFGHPRCIITPGCVWSKNTCSQKSCTGRSVEDCIATAGCENKFVYNFPKNNSSKRVPPTHTCERKKL